jgi:peptide-methionine (S)-S-oxide reductase
MSTKETATFAGGCFWCTEAIFKELRGVTSVLPGYAGGSVEDPSYEEVSSGETGHAEAIQIEFDPAEISFDDLAEIFFKTHDPTTENRQGNDVGPQYRSVIFYHDDRQKQSAEKVKSEIEKSKIYPDPLVTQIVPFTNFFVAEDYHKNYYENNRSQGYCQVVIDPKIHKLRKQFRDRLKDEYRDQD